MPGESDFCLLGKIKDWSRDSSQPIIWLGSISPFYNLYYTRYPTTLPPPPETVAAWNFLKNLIYIIRDIYNGSENPSLAFSSVSWTECSPLKIHWNPKQLQIAFVLVLGNFPTLSVIVLLFLHSNQVKSYCERKHSPGNAPRNCLWSFVTWPHGPRAGAVRIDLSLKLKVAKKQRCKVPFRAAVAGFADDHDDVRPPINKDSATMTGTFIIIFILNLFLVVLFGRKETCLNTLRLVHHELAVSHSHRAGPSPSPSTLRGWGVDLHGLSVEAAEYQCWLEVVSNIVIVRVFSVVCSNMYNVSINELYILRGNLYICAHNRKVCVRMIIVFYPATRARVHFTKCDRCVLLPPASGAGPAATLFLPPRFRTPSTFYPSDFNYTVAHKFGIFFFQFESFQISPCHLKTKLSWKMKLVKLLPDIVGKYTQKFNDIQQVMLQWAQTISNTNNRDNGAKL